MSSVQKTINPDRVAIYIRWSTDEQSDGTTLGVQRDGCRHYLLSQGWRVNESLIFLDNGYSGGNLNRPGLDQLRKLIRQGHVDCLVVFKVDRLSRSVMVVVRRIFELYNAGEGAKAVVNKLNSEGISFRNGRPWNERTVLYLLSNRVYVGDMVYGRMTRNSRRGKGEGEVFWSRNETPMVVEDSTFLPAIVSRPQFELAQASKRQRTTAPGKPGGRSISSAYLLTGIAKCACGYGLFGSVNVSKSGRAYAYYGCIGKKIRGLTTCQSGRIPHAQLDAEVESKIRQEFGDRLARSAYIDRLAAAHQQHLQTVGLEMVQVEKQILELGEQDKKIRRDYRFDLLTVDEYRRLSNEIEDEITQSKNRLGSLMLTLQKLSGEALNVQIVSTSFEQLNRWELLRVTERKNILRCFVRALSVYRDVSTGTVNLHLEWATSESSM